MSESARRTLRVMKILKGRTIDGLAVIDIATAINETPTNTVRCLQDLSVEGLVEKKPTGRYSLSIQMHQIAEAHREEMQRARQRLDEMNQRTTRTVY